MSNNIRIKARDKWTKGWARKLRKKKVVHFNSLRIFPQGTLPGIAHGWSIWIELEWFNRCYIQNQTYLTQIHRIKDHFQSLGDNIWDTVLQPRCVPPANSSATEGTAVTPGSFQQSPSVAGIYRSQRAQIPQEKQMSGRLNSTAGRN